MDDSVQVELVDVCVEKQDVMEYYWVKEFCRTKVDKETEYYSSGNGEE
jgi:hypothetical protein